MNRVREAKVQTAIRLLERLDEQSAIGQRVVELRRGGASRREAATRLGLANPDAARTAEMSYLRGGRRRAELEARIAWLRRGGR